MEEPIEVYITKYALTNGIEKKMARVCKGNHKMIKIDAAGLGEYYYNNDWHLTLGDAQRRAEEMRSKKIASLKKSMLRLEKMNFYNQ